MSTYQHSAQRQAHVPVRQLCQVLRGRLLCLAAPPAGANAEPAWQGAVREAFAYHSQRVRHGLRAQLPRSFVPRTTDSDPAVRAAPTHLLGPPPPPAPNRVWVGDIAYLPRQGGG